ncbi:MAG: hypothetical protein RR975_02500 [Clostridia bacterium]
MKRQWKLILCLSLAAATLCACSGTPPVQPFPQMTQNLGPNVATATPEPAVQQPDANTQPNEDGGTEDGSIFSNNPYDVAPQDDAFTPDDAMNEEGMIDPNLTGDEVNNYDSAAAAGTEYPYAGSTPIPLDPIDMPTPTPRPKLAFTYMPYTSAIGVSFEAPAGWLVDETQSETFIISEPTDQIKENQQCIVTLTAFKVNSNYSESNLKTEVKQRLDNIKATNFTTWKPSLTASRYLMGSKGVYANYSGELANGTQLGGRIHYTCVDKVLYGLEIVYPLGYKDDYLGVFSKVRETLKLN